jgi:hypothetical protein
LVPPVPYGHPDGPLPLAAGEAKSKLGGLGGKKI